MIKLIIFDLDGVLVETKQIHYDTLNEALNEIDPKYKISKNDHLSIYDGLKTSSKLDMLTRSKGLPKEYHALIWERKQKLTIDALSELNKNDDLDIIFKSLKNQNYKLACCSNSIRLTVLTILTKLDLINYFDIIISNEDVKNGKPHPEMYWKAISELKILPEETLIIEDSPIGLLGAHRSGANVLRVSSPEDISLSKITNKINKIKNMNTPKWQSDNLNILIPMAGAGSRFAQVGYSFPKPLIDVNGKPMIQRVVDNINMDAHYIYVAQKEHINKYNLHSLLNLITPNCTILEIDGITEGAACTTLIAKDFINNNSPLIIANSDQLLEWNSNEFMYKMVEQGVDGGIVTFKDTHPKWSFVKIGDQGNVTEVAEKNPISDIATAGIYYWSSGEEYVKYAEQMIDNNTKTNNEFYVCPVFNEAIKDGKNIKIFNIEKIWGLGTPEDLEYYLKNNK